MKSKEWLEIIEQAKDYNKNYTPLIIKYGEMLIDEQKANLLDAQVTSVTPITCKTCKHFLSYQDEYEDNLEPTDCGFYKHPRKTMKHTDIENTCEMHEPKELK